LSIHEAMTFCERMATDHALRERAAAAVDDKEGPEAASALLVIAAAEGHEFTQAELSAVGRHILSGRELSEDQLASVSGGTVGEDAQLANVDLQNVLQKQQQAIQTMSNISKTVSDTALSIIRKIGG
jgi:predicted ribosomally synthesized peptide with nif11-like leader